MATMMCSLPSHIFSSAQQIVYSVPRKLKALKKNIFLNPRKAYITYERKLWKEEAEKIWESVPQSYEELRVRVEKVIKKESRQLSILFLAADSLFHNLKKFFDLKCYGDLGSQTGYLDFIRNQVSLLVQIVIGYNELCLQLLTQIEDLEQQNKDRHTPQTTSQQIRKFPLSP